MADGGRERRVRARLSIGEIDSVWIYTVTSSMYRFFEGSGSAVRTSTTGRTEAGSAGVLSQRLAMATHSLRCRLLSNWPILNSQRSFRATTTLPQARRSEWQEVMTNESGATGLWCKYCGPGAPLRVE